MNGPILLQIEPFWPTFIPHSLCNKTLSASHWVWNCGCQFLFCDYILFLSPDDRIGILNIQFPSITKKLTIAFCCLVLFSEPCPEYKLNVDISHYCTTNQESKAHKNATITVYDPTYTTAISSYFFRGGRHVAICPIFRENTAHRID